MGPRGVRSGLRRLYQDGKVLGVQHLAGQGTFWVGQGTHDYRLVADVTRDQPWWPLSTKVGAEWTFQSGYAQGPFTVPLPLLSVRAEPPVDLTNRAPAGPVDIPLTVSRQDGPATISAVALEYATDDGAADGFVSLRTRATDTDGNTVALTVVQAYQVG